MGVNDQFKTGVKAGVEIMNEQSGVSASLHFCSTNLCNSATNMAKQSVWMLLASAVAALWILTRN